MNASEYLWWSVNIGSVNSVVQLDNKPLPDPVLTHIYVAISLGYNELTYGRLIHDIYVYYNMFWTVFALARV